eukprot:UN18693
MVTVRAREHTKQAGITSSTTEYNIREQLGNKGWHASATQFGICNSHEAFKKSCPKIRVVGAISRHLTATPYMEVELFLEHCVLINDRPT